jgi:hypothetical protein
MKKITLSLLSLALCVAAAVSSSTAAQALAAPVREGFAEVPGARIWYEDTGGQGIPVIFLHAASGIGRNWDGQFPAFTKAGYRCIAYDRRGWGRSVSVPGGPQPGTAADDLQGLVEYLQFDRFHIVATAAGGGVALDSRFLFRSEFEVLWSRTRLWASWKMKDISSSHEALDLRRLTLYRSIFGS